MPDAETYVDDQIRTFSILNQTRDMFSYKNSKFEEVHESAFEEHWKIHDFDDKERILIP
jgi:hypothetical protein